MKLTPIREYNWDGDYSEMRTLTCINHQTAKYLTKNPWARGLHLINLPVGDIPRTDSGECTCPLSDLVVIEKGIDVTTYPNGRRLISLLTYAAMEPVILAPRSLINLHKEIEESEEIQPEKDKAVNELYRAHINNCMTCRGDSAINDYFNELCDNYYDLVMRRYWDMKINTRVIRIHYPA